MPTALVRPWPSGPVVVSTPGVTPTSGWPGVLLCSWRKLLQLARAAGRSRSGAAAHRPASTPWPLDSTKRSRSGQCGLRRVVAQVAAPQRDRDLGHAHRRARDGPSWPAARRPSTSARIALAICWRRPRAAWIVGHRGRVRGAWRCGGNPAILKPGSAALPARGRARGIVYSARMQGLHLTADLCGCRCERALADRRRQRCGDWCLAAVDAAGCTPVGELFHRFAPAPGAAARVGVTGVVLLAESHVCGAHLARARARRRSTSTSASRRRQLGQGARR